MGQHPRWDHPHARVGGPHLYEWQANLRQSSPRTWGWTVPSPAASALRQIIPTHVGVDRPPAPGPRRRGNHPHARGGGPAPPLAGSGGTTSSPRTWGWTADDQVLRVHQDIIPTHVGVDRRPWPSASLPSYHPHARGGGPIPLKNTALDITSSPRTWGWAKCVSAFQSPSAMIPTERGADEPGQHKLSSPTRRAVPHRAVSTRDADRSSP